MHTIVSKQQNTFGLAFRKLQIVWLASSVHRLLASSYSEPPHCRIYCSGTKQLSTWSSSNLLSNLLTILSKLFDLGNSIQHLLTWNFSTKFVQQRLVKQTDQPAIKCDNYRKLRTNPFPPIHLKRSSDEWNLPRQPSFKRPAEQATPQ